MDKEYLDLKGLSAYDELIKQYIKIKSEELDSKTEEKYTWIELGQS